MFFSDSRAYFKDKNREMQNTLRYLTTTFALCEQSVSLYLKPTAASSTWKTTEEEQARHKYIEQNHQYAQKHEKENTVKTCGQTQKWKDS